MFVRVASIVPSAFWTPSLSNSDVWNWSLYFIYTNNKKKQQQKGTKIILSTLITLPKHLHLFFLVISSSFSFSHVMIVFNLPRFSFFFLFLFSWFKMKQNRVISTINQKDKCFDDKTTIKTQIKITCTQNDQLNTRTKNV